MYIQFHLYILEVYQCVSGSHIANQNIGSHITNASQLKKYLQKEHPNSLL